MKETVLLLNNLDIVQKLFYNFVKDHFYYNRDRFKEYVRVLQYFLEIN